MKIPDKVSAYWNSFVKLSKNNPESRYYETFNFSNDEVSANQLLALVLTGKKKATASLLWVYEDENEIIPVPGSLSIVTDWKGNPKCIIETVNVEIIPFKDVGEEFAVDEGEGDCSLSYWRKVHWRFFSEECKNLGKEPTPDMPVVCERFKVVG